MNKVLDKIRELLFQAKQLEETASKKDRLAAKSGRSVKSITNQERKDAAKMRRKANLMKKRAGL